MLPSVGEKVNLLLPPQHLVDSSENRCHYHQPWVFTIQLWVLSECSVLKSHGLSSNFPELRFHFPIFSRLTEPRLVQEISPILRGSFRGATGRVALSNVDAASGSVPVPLQRLAPFDYVLVDAPCTSVTWIDLDREFPQGCWLCHGVSCLFLQGVSSQLMFYYFL